MKDFLKLLLKVVISPFILIISLLGMAAIFILLAFTSEWVFSSPTTIIIGAIIIVIAVGLWKEYKREHPDIIKRNDHFGV